MEGKGAILASELVVVPSWLGGIGSCLDQGIFWSDMIQLRRFDPPFMSAV